MVREPSSLLNTPPRMPPPAAEGPGPGAVGPGGGGGAVADCLSWYSARRCRSVFLRPSVGRPAARRAACRPFTVVAGAAAAIASESGPLVAARASFRAAASFRCSPPDLCRFRGPPPPTSRGFRTGGPSAVPAAAAASSAGGPGETAPLARPGAPLPAAAAAALAALATCSRRVRSPLIAIIAPSTKLPRKAVYSGPKLLASSSRGLTAALALMKAVRRAS